MISLLVQSHLPDGGLKTLLDQPLQSVLNALHGSRAHPEDPAGFPLAWAAMAPNAPEFLASLGRPLAIARDLESAPGVWWLAGPQGHPQFVIFSDAHRKNQWKGGQLCMVKRSGEDFHPQHPGLVALTQALSSLWGHPDPVGLDSPFAALEWFAQRAQQAGPIVWPRQPQDLIRASSPRPK